MARLTIPRDDVRVSRPMLTPDDLPTTPEAMSIVDFLTDGALPAFAQELSVLTGAAISLHAVTGGTIVADTGEMPWIVHDLTPGDAAIASALASVGPGTTLLPIEGSRTLAPLMAQGQAIGGLVIEGPTTPSLCHAIERIASIISDLCTRERQLRARHDELALLIRVASLFVTAQKLETILEIALVAADRVLGADAAIVHLCHADGNQLRPIAHVGLSTEFVEQFNANEAPRAKDPAVSEGLAVVVPELKSVGSPRFADVFQREGLSSMLVCGLVHRGRILGVVRLFRRSDRPYARTQQALLQTLAEQIAGALAAAEYVEHEREADHMRRQLQLASDVQRRMLPADRFAFAGLDVAARYVSALSVSGDFYDFIELGSHVGVVVGDVVGKGVPAAMLMASVRSLFRAHALDLEPGETLVDEVVRRVNITLTRDTLPGEFATAFFAVIDPQSRTLTYCSAGHDPPLLYRTKSPDAGPELLDHGGALLGIDETHVFERTQLDLAPGDTIVAYSDGVPDAMNFEYQKFGRMRLIESVRDQLASDPNSTAKTIVDRVVWDVRRFVGLNTKNDDLTVMVLRMQL